MDQKQLSKPVIGITYSSDELDEFRDWPWMFQGIAEAGGIPVAIDASQKLECLDSLVPRLDGLIISGGRDISPTLYGADTNDPTLQKIDPMRDHNEIRAWEIAQANDLGVLAICRGAHLLNAVLGGSMYVDLQRDFGGDLDHKNITGSLFVPIHEVRIDPESTVHNWLGHVEIIKVNSQHHQGIRELAAGLKAVAFSTDGLIEAYEYPEKKLVAVQWHPEVLWATDPTQLTLLRAFVDSLSK